MKKHFNSARATVTAISIASALLALQGCGTTTVSKDVSDEGKPGTVVFPDIQKSAWLKEGTFPNLDNLRRIAPGVSKDQLYDLAGRPHFSEGLSSVREWDYIFNFRTGKGAEFITCQYKVVYRWPSTTCSRRARTHGRRCFRDWCLRRLRQCRR